MTRDQVIRLLGTPPTDPWGDEYARNTDWYCTACKEYVPADSIAWDTYDHGGPDEGYSVLCISCALQAELDREAEDER